MAEHMDKKLWELLKEKQVSLAMLINNKREVLWHRGSRDLKGMSASTCIVPIGRSVNKSVGDQLFLYIDSGSEDSFSETDREVFKVIGELLGEMIRRSPNQQKGIDGITGTSEDINKVRELALTYSLEDEPVLLLGETGVGKSRIAEFIHRHSGRRGKFVTVNTPAIPANLFESEIFGYKKGAFTDARVDKRGLVDEALGGTLFFDEISEVPLSFQAKLLRFIDTRKYQVLGKPLEREADVRIVAATNTDLAQAIKGGRFREDLYFRLQVLEIEIPPLRERRQDIKALAQENRGLLRGKELGEGFWDALYSHAWPGNIRELMTTLCRVGLHAPDPIGGGEIGKIIRQSRYQKLFPKSSDKIERLWHEIKTGKSFWQTVWQPFIHRDLNRDEISAFLKESYERCQFSFKTLSRQMHIKDSEYKRFIAALHNYDIHPVRKNGYTPASIQYTQ
jgi:transcriptional regulator with PAS, ATPase and Fis domain